MKTHSPGEGWQNPARGAIAHEHHAGRTEEVHASEVGDCDVDADDPQLRLAGGTLDPGKAASREASRLLAVNRDSPRKFRTGFGLPPECTLHVRKTSFGMLLASISFRAQPHKRGEILSAVDETLTRIRCAAGCARSRLFVDTEDPNSFALVSEWASRSDADAFFDSSGFQIFKGIRMLMKDEPVIVLDEIGARVTRLIRSR